MASNLKCQQGKPLTVCSGAFSLWGMANLSNKKRSRKAVMLGLGLDTDGHKRLTTGPNFVLLGGSAETHETMTEKVLKINEKLSAKGKQLAEVSGEEFDDIARSVGLERQDRK